MSKNSMKKIMLSTLVFFFLMIVATGCGSKESGNVDAGDGEWAGQSIKVQMIGDFKQESATDPITGEKTEGVEILKEEFESQYPGATVDFILMPWEGYAEKTQAMITSNEADVYQMPGIMDYAPQGILEPLQSYIDEDDFDLDRFIESQVDGWKVLGPEDEKPEVYGLPFLGDARFIAYDKQIFDDWGVEHLSKYPTMEEIAEKAELMTGENPKTGEKNNGIWFRGDWDSAFRLINVAEGQNGSWGEGFNWDEIEFAFNSKEMVSGMEWLLDMKEFAPNGIVSNQGNEKWLTEDNNVAIMLNQGPGDTIKQVYAEGLEDRIGIAQEFKNDDGMGGYFAGSPIAISKNSENKDLAWEWLKFATSDFAQKYIFEEQGLVPSVAAAEDWESVNEMDLMMDVFEAMKTPWTPRYPWAAAQPRFILTSEVESVLTGERSPEDALDKAQKESTEWLENR